MPAYIIAKQMGGHSIADLGLRIQGKSQIETILEHTYINPPSAAKLTSDSYRHPIIKKFDCRDTWMVKELNGGDDWKRSNIIFIVSPVTRGEAVLKHRRIMSARAATGSLHKECLITVGATASFEELVQAALEPENLKLLRDNGFTTVNFQCGNSLKAFHDLKPAASGMELLAFDFNRNGLHEEIMACKEVPGKSAKGLVISHAGAGTILDVMRMGVPLIVVPNPSLLDNHQEELAMELERQGYVTRGDVKALGAAIEKACALANKAWGNQNVVQGVGMIASGILGYQEPKVEEDGPILDGIFASEQDAKMKEG